MPAFPRTKVCSRTSRPRLAGPLVSVGQSGKPQVRSTLQVGWSWSETWDLLEAGDATVEAFLAQLEGYWRAGTVLDMDHRLKRTLLGAGGGTPQVNGASQTGTSLATKLWPNSTTVLKAGDVFRIAGLNQVFQLTADATSGGTGLATLSITPPIFCLGVNERVVTADLRWVPVGNLVVGDQLLSFDEELDPVTRRRYWRTATVLRSDPVLAECVRVVLGDGTAVTCTADHPWLSGIGGCEYAWRTATDLAFQPRRRSPQRTVIRALTPWEPAQSYHAGWLAGLFDGEGHLKMGPKGFDLTVTQNAGPTHDGFVDLMRSAGFDARSYSARKAHHPIQHVAVCGGLSEIARCLGVLRPRRLLPQWSEGINKGTRRVTGEQVPVVSVRPIGRQLVQSITTSTKTYIGEGFLMHNTGGSPAADAALTINSTPGNVTYRVVIVGFEAPEAVPPQFYGGLRVTVMETL